MRPGLRRAAPGTGAAAGAIAMVAGTFAPWLQSGQVTRNSYRTAGLFQRLLGIDGAAGAALDALPLLALLCAALGGIYVLGWRRPALLGLSLLALACGALAVAALGADGAHGVRVTPIGPIITLLGSILIVLATVVGMMTRSADEQEQKLPAPPIPRPAGERP